MNPGYVDALAAAVAGTDPAVLRVLLQADASADTAMELALTSSNLAALKIILEARPRLADTFQRNGHTALEVASWCGNEGAVALLLACGVALHHRQKERPWGNPEGP